MTSQPTQTITGLTPPAPIPARAADTVRAEFPAKLRFLFKPSRYKVAYGGRGGVKSWSFARALLIHGARRKLKILCAREYQNSIRDSVHALLKQQIELLGLSAAYAVQQVSILGANGTEIIFAGIANDPQRIKSTEGIDICWVEEAQKVSADSWAVLVPTIRKSGSEIWVSFNPDLETDPTYKMFVSEPRPDAIVVQTGWQDNRWLSDELRAEKDYLARVDPDAYAHVWGGGCRMRSDSQVLGGKCFVESFVPGPEWDGPYYGADWGFSQDPSVLVKLWIGGRTLYVQDEAYGIAVELDDLPELFGRVSGAKANVIRADSSRPETISHVRARGFDSLQAAEKWPGSVEDGVAFLRSFERIVIHPRCRHFEEESRLYSYKVDRLTGDVLPTILDCHNHCMDAARYALQPMIRQTADPGFFFLDYLLGSDPGNGNGNGLDRAPDLVSHGADGDEEGPEEQHAELSDVRRADRWEVWANGD